MKSSGAMHNLRSGGLPTSYLIEVLEEVKQGEKWDTKISLNDGNNF